MREYIDLANEVVWENYIPQSLRHVGFELDSKKVMPLKELASDVDCFAPFILLHIFHLHNKKIEAINLFVDIKVDRDSLLGLRMLDYSLECKEINHLNRLIIDSGAELFDRILSLNAKSDKSRCLYEFIAFCRNFMEEHFEDDSKVLDTQLISSLYKYSNVEKGKPFTKGATIRTLEKSSQTQSLPNREPVDFKSNCDDFGLFSNDDLFNDCTDEKVELGKQPAVKRPKQLQCDKLIADATLTTHHASDIDISARESSSETVINVINAELTDLLTLENIAQRGDSTIKQFVEKLQLIYKNPKTKNKPIDETIFWAAIVSSPLIRKAVTSVTTTKGDIIPTSAVSELLREVDARVDNRLYGSGDEDGKSWFEWDLPNVRILKVSASITSVLSYIFKDEDNKVVLDLYRVSSLLKLALQFDGLPVTKKIIQKTDLDRLQLSEACATIKEKLDEEIFGQNEAKEALVSAWRATRMGTGPSSRGPVFFYGASGVGKTSLATTFVDALNLHEVCDGAYDLQVINLEMLTNENDLLNLLGSSHIYNVASLGTLTTPTEFLPNRVIVFDEVEKAHKSLIQGLLSIISSRDCTDRTTRRQVSFDNCIFIFTSNIGAKHSAKDNQASHLSILSEGGLSPEFINRLQQGHIARCKPLSEDEKVCVLNKIASEAEQQLQINFDGHLPQALAMMAGELNPRRLIGQKSQLISLISAEEDSHVLLARLTEHKTEVAFELPKGHEDLHKLVVKMGSRKWRTEIAIKSAFDDDNILITITLGNPKLEYETEHLDCPFITFIESGTSAFGNIIGNDNAISQLKGKAQVMNKQLEGGLSQEVENTLLFGPPGSGKTELAASIATDFIGPFLKVDSANLTVGDFEQNVSYLFDVCRHYSPCVLFLDEFDAIARKREGESARVTLMTTALLTAVDGMQRNHGVWVIAATNYPDVIDDALLREGRFGEKIDVQFPEQRDIEEYIKRFLQEARIEIEEVYIQQLGQRFASKSVGYIKSIITTAIKASSSCYSFYRACVKTCLDRSLGTACPVHSESTCNITAYHEAGHAVATGLLDGFDTILAVDTCQRSKSAGFVQRKRRERGTLVTKRAVKNDIQIALAGRAAELILAGHEDGLTLGAGKDLSAATELACHAISTQGFSDKDSLVDTRYFKTSEHDIEQEANEWLLEAHHHVVELLKQNWHLVETLVNALQSRKLLLTEEVVELTERAQERPSISNTLELH